MTSNEQAGGLVVEYWPEVGRKLQRLTLVRDDLYCRQSDATAVWNPTLPDIIKYSYCRMQEMSAGQWAAVLAHETMHASRNIPPPYDHNRVLREETIGYAAQGEMWRRLPEFHRLGGAPEWSDLLNKLATLDHYPYLTALRATGAA